MHRSKARISQHFGRVALWALGLGALGVQAAALACSKEAPAAVEPESKVAASRAAEPAAAPAAPPAEEAPAAAPAEPADPAGGALPAANKKFSEASFDLEIKPKGNYTAGQSAEVEVVLAAKDPYHVNDKYPFKLKLEDAEGVSYPDKVVKKESVKLETKRAVMTVKFTPASKGKKHIAGQFSFSICTEERCLIEKRDLAVDVTVN